MMYTDAMIKFPTTTKKGNTKHLTEKGKIAEGTGLGYWIADKEEVSPFYAITHLPSGSRLFPEPFYSEALTQKVIEAIAPICDFNQTPEQLEADFKNPDIVAKLAEALKQTIEDFYEPKA